MPTTVKELLVTKRWEIPVWMFLLISLILYSVAFTVDKWSQNDNNSNEYNTVTELCSEIAGITCCKTHSDRDVELPDWILHNRRAFRATWAFIGINFIFLLIKWCNDKWDTCLSFMVSITSYVSAVCIIVAVAVFSKNYKADPSLFSHSVGVTFKLCVTCIVLHVLAPFPLIIKSFQACTNSCKPTPQTTRVEVLPSSSNRSQNAPPIITVLCNEYEGWKGKNLAMTCDIFSPSTLKKIWWRKGNKDLDMFNVKYRISQTCGELIIRNVGLTDDGKYQCVAKNDSGTTFSAIMTLKIFTVPVLIPCNQSYVGRKDENLQVACRIRSKPQVRKIHWKKLLNDNLIKINSSPKYQSVDSASLTIRNLQLSDAGVFQCFAENIHGTGESGMISVKVLYKPLIEVDFDEYIGMIGGNLILSCSIMSEPKVSMISWGKKESGVWRDVGDDATKYTRSSTVSPWLQINNLIQSDSGKYRCVAHNQIGIGTSCEITVTISGPKTQVTPAVSRPVAQEHNENAHLCKICQDNEKDVIFLNCGHFAACGDCASQIQQTTNECPICRARIVDIRPCFSV